MAKQIGDGISFYGRTATPEAIDPTTISQLSM